MKKKDGEEKLRSRNKGVKTRKTRKRGADKN